MFVCVKVGSAGSWLVFPSSRSGVLFIVKASCSQRKSILKSRKISG